VKGEKANNQAEFEAALKRGIQATKNGNPYLLDVAISRTGGGAESTWHEGFKLSNAPDAKLLPLDQDRDPRAYNPNPPLNSDSVTSSSRHCCAENWPQWRGPSATGVSP
jgi:hypothetical protein